MRESVLSCAVCLLEMAIATAAKGDMRAFGEDIAITHANTTSDEFAEWVRQWARCAQVVADQRRERLEDRVHTTAAAIALARESGAIMPRTTS